MAIFYGKFEMPQKIQLDDSQKDKNRQRFIIEPFEKGFGHTLGNALRRIMLTSLESPAVIAIRIEGVAHEFTAIDGVVEDMIHIVLNFKGARLRFLPEEGNKYGREAQYINKQIEVTEEQIEKAGGQRFVTVADVFSDSNFDLVNLEHVLFTVTKPFSKMIEATIAIGRGYVPSERLVPDIRKTDEIILDAAFSPVVVVNYFVENTRVGQDTDFDRLILEIQTDGRISAKEALTFAAQIAKEHLDVFQHVKTHEISFEVPEIENNKDKEEILRKLSLKINEIELSVRSTNCLSGANIETIGELVVMPESEMLKFRNFGKKSLTEIKEKLEELGLSLGMDLSRYGITRDNIKTVIENYHKEKVGVEE